jgi:hypothetical protein
MRWDDMMHQLDVAPNAVALLGVEVDPSRRVAAATFRVLTLPVEVLRPRTLACRSSSTRSAESVALLRNGRWDDATTAVLPLT